MPTTASRVTTVADAGALVDTRDVDMTNHGNPTTHPEWPHEHIWDWNQNPPRQ